MTPLARNVRVVIQFAWTLVTLLVLLLPAVGGSDVDLTDPFERQEATEDEDREREPDLSSPLGHARTAQRGGLLSTEPEARIIAPPASRPRRRPPVRATPPTGPPGR